MSCIGMIPRFALELITSLVISSWGPRVGGPPYSVIRCLVEEGSDFHQLTVVSLSCVPV